METILDTTLQTLGFHHFFLSYLEEKVLRFIDNIDKPKLTIKHKDNNQPIIDSKDKNMRNGLEYVAKKKRNVIIFVFLYARPLLLAQ